MAKVTPNLLARPALADHLGVHPMTITRWEREYGMPIESRGARGRPSLYSVKDVAAWKASRDRAAVPATSAKSRKELAQAMESEQRIAIRAKTLVLASEIEQLIADEYSRCRTKLLGLPRKARAMLPHLSVKDVVAIDVLVREALEDLASA